MANTTPRPIVRLDEAVVNRIAAGEVIQRPANALKELVENSLDAKSSSIQVTVKDGGLKLLQIQDNGTGIRKEDMGIVCERFTTSKLEKYEDLSSISTYGFRGEALASITHVAHLSITTRTSDSKCAYKGTYVDGKLKDVVKPCAGNTGTQITIEDLFFNVPTRRQALKNTAEEYHKIIDVISKYAVHNSNVSFTLRKSGDNSPDVKTPGAQTPLDAIRVVHGATLTRELLDISYADSNLSFKCHCIVSNANYSTKKPVFILFINHRLVDSTTLRRAIDSVYAAYLSKQTHPFIYLSLEIAPQNVDVNVHPTKHEVHFLHEERIIESVQRAIDGKLLGSNTSRTFCVQATLPHAAALVPTEQLIDVRTSDSGTKPAANQLVRTDSREQKLDAFLGRKSTAVSPPSELLQSSGVADRSDTSNDLVEPLADSLDDCNFKLRHQVKSCLTASSSSSTAVASHQSKNTATAASHNVSRASAESTKTFVTPKSSRLNKAFTPQTGETPKVQLASVLSLRRAIEHASSTGLRDVLREHTFCGCISPELALIQHRTKLYLVNTRRLTQEYFYQRVLMEFGDLAVMKFSEAVSLFDLAMLALDLPESGWSAVDGTKEELAGFVVELLKSKAEMLREYFSMEIDAEGNLCSVPLLLDRYMPPIERLPMYVLRLATDVEWEMEKECFETFARETAAFYAVSDDWLTDATPLTKTTPSDSSSAGQTSLKDQSSLSEQSTEPTLPCVVDDSLSRPTALEERCNINIENAGRSSQSDVETFSSTWLNDSFSQTAGSCSSGDTAELTTSSAGPAAASAGPAAGEPQTDWKWIVEHVVFPALRSGFEPAKRFAEDGSVLQIANLPDLYKVFERC